MLLKCLIAKIVNVTDISNLHITSKITDNMINNISQHIAFLLPSLEIFRKVLKRIIDECLIPRIKEEMI